MKRIAPIGPASRASVLLTSVLLTFACGTFALCAPDARAADVARGANLLAMGETGAAAAGDNTALTLNPGLLGLTERYDFQGLFQVGPDNGLHWGFSGMDARNSEYLAGGISYSGDIYEPRPIPADELPGWKEAGSELTNRKRLHDLAIGAAVPFFERKLSVGLATGIRWYDHDLQGKGVGFDLDAGVGVRPVEPLTFGVALRNWLPLGGLDRPTSVVGGLRVELPELLAVEANAEWPGQGVVADGALPLAIGGGVELAAGVARIRAGARRGADGLASVTAGLGWEREGAALEYGISIPLQQTTLASTVHGFQIRFSAPADLTEPE